ncbi:23S rRNA (uracil(1939)-C(5))-methyltransferase RlmD [Ruminococcus flavefaciens]|uniref:TRAM domain-containing protein n=1 Tax=Ruminococcus flavefaciens 007c TaxID=1341157 RepID=W7UJ25_RUMFL|nr:23S rRNA (uracil(1939)-C(5))-methyltransferase RlmD [Ruminococcus flavefaciens]EWM53793.1 hypothetical protein RF007C_08745 [Ruminococcus flavefaciens 007c]
MPEKNQVYTAEITGLTSEGSGVCRIDGMAVFVPQTAVGDICGVKIVKVLKSYAFGKAEEILTPSPDRIEDNCPVYKKCGGCLLRHISYEAECRTKEGIVRDAFERIGGLFPEFDEFIGAESTERYRNKAQYPLAVRDGRAVCGFYAPRSHRVIPVEDCALQPEIFSDILQTVLDYINVKKLSVYSEETNTGIIRHIYLRRGAHSGQIMVCIVVRKDISRQLSALCRLLSEKYSDINSIIMNINPDNTNVILGDRCITLWGSDTISDTMCGNNVEISPLSFYQVNTVQAERLYAKALEYAAPGSSETIADLYCGAGTIGLSMAKQAAKIVGVEIIPQAVENAKENALRNGITNAEFHCGDAGEVFGKLRRQGCKPDIIVVDPPRKGCSSETVDIISEAAPKKIVMISCNPATAARDAKLLSERGYSVDKVCGVDLFPRTGHVECVVLLSRQKS